MTSPSSMDVDELIDALTSGELFAGQVISELLHREREIDERFDRQRRYYEQTIDELSQRMAQLELMLVIPWEHTTCA